MKKSLVWFGNNLRSRDNTVLLNACKEAQNIIAVYCFDPYFFRETEFGFKKTGKFRARFLIQSVENLRENLKKLNIPLFVFNESPSKIIPKLIEDHSISHLFLQKEWTRDERKEISEVKGKLGGSVKIVSLYDQFLFHPNNIPYDDFSDIPKVFTGFRKKCEKHCEVRKEAEKLQPLPEENLFDTETEIQTLEALGLEEFEEDPRTAFPFNGGEDAAWQRIQEYFWKTENLASYKQTRNGLVGKNYSSKLSAWLTNGCISARSVYWEVKRFEEKITKNEDTYWLIFELIWRDFFKYISLKHGEKIFHLGGILQKEYQWKKDPEALQNWIKGNTKYDFVNANMNEIAQTGWMSNRGRQNVASFWAKEMQQDWRVGASYFESLLIDYDVHSNWGNWMYNAGVGNDPRDRKFNIEKQAERYDADGEFQKLWKQ